MLLKSLLLFATLASAALAPIRVKGNAFFDSESNDRFYMRGVVYKSGTEADGSLSDPLANITSCTRDIPALKNLGINTVRVYHIDNSANHDACMKLLDDAGIYVIVNLDSPYIPSLPSFYTDDPAIGYNASYLQQVFSTIDAVKSYNNVLGFFVGLSIPDYEGRGSTYVKAIIRDTKNYIKKHSARVIPVGFPVPEYRLLQLEQVEYLNCGDDDMARADMIGIDNFVWCTDRHWEGYYNDYADFEIGEVYSTNPTSVFSGAVAFEYYEEGSPYRLVDITQDASGDDAVVYLPGYSYLKAQYSSASSLSGDGGYKSSGTAASCPNSEANFWEANTSLPSLPSNATIYMINGAGKALSTGSSAASTKTSGAGSGNADLLIDSKTNGIVLGSLGAVVVIIFGFVGF